MQVSATVLDAGLAQRRGGAEDMTTRPKENEISGEVVVRLCVCAPLRDRSAIGSGIRRSRLHKTRADRKHLHRARWRSPARSLAVSRAEARRRRGHDDPTQGERDLRRRRGTPLRSLRLCAIDLRSEAASVAHGCTRHEPTASRYAAAVARIRWPRFGRLAIADAVSLGLAPRFAPLTAAQDTRRTASRYAAAVARIQNQ